MRTLVRNSDPRSKIDTSQPGLARAQAMAAKKPAAPPPTITFRFSVSGGPGISAQRQPVSWLGQRLGVVEREIRVFLQKSLVIGQQLHAVVRFEAITLDRCIHLRLQQPHEL